MPIRPSLDRQILTWMFSDNTGLSSLAMASAVAGIPMEDSHHSTAHPHDPADLGRCLSFCKAVPDAHLHFDKIAALSPAWKNLIAHWDELSARYNDLPKDYFGNAHAHALYNRIQELTRGS